MTAQQADELIPITFAIVGVQKAATSTMHTMLTKHRLVAAIHENRLHPGRMKAFGRKELHFFDDEARDWDRPDYSLYHAVRTKRPQRIAGDATPIYLFWPRALERMHAFNPDMRLVASFRDPIERAVSQWAMESKRRRPYPGFSECIETMDDESLIHQIPAQAHGWWVHRHSLVPRGLYGVQLRRGLEIYDRSQWLLLSFRDFINDYTAVLDRLTDHLGIHRFRNYPKLRENPTPGTRRASRSRPRTCGGWPIGMPTTWPSSRDSRASTPPPGRPGNCWTAAWMPRSWPSDSPANWA